MKKLWLLAVLMLLSCLPSLGQTLQYRADAPTGYCGQSIVFVNYITGFVYTCKNGVWFNASGSGGGGGFDAITSGTNITAAMVLGTGSSLTVSGSGTNNATSLLGSNWASPAAIGTITPAAGTFTQVTTNGTGADIFTALADPACTTTTAIWFSTTTANAFAICDGASHIMKLTANANATVAFGSGGTVTYTVASGTSAMGTSLITTGACASVVTTAATGTATTSKIVATPSVNANGVTGYSVAAGGSLYIQAYPTANNVNFLVCNPTSGSLTPGALTLNWTVLP